MKIINALFLALLLSGILGLSAASVMADSHAEEEEWGASNLIPEE